MWKRFLADFQCLHLIPSFEFVTNDGLDFFTDSSGQIRNGFACYCQKQWAMGKWNESCLAEKPSITSLELYPILMDLYIWKDKIANKHVIFQSDNEMVCLVILNQTSRCDKIMALVRLMVIHCLKYNIEIKCQHIQWVFNKISDSLSQMNFQKFRQLVPDVEENSQPLSEEIWPLSMELLNRVNL